MRLLEIHDDQIGALPRLERPGDVARVHCARPDARRHRQRVARRQRRRVAAHTLGEQRRQPHLLEHVEIVVRRGAVGADADCDAKLQHLRDRRHP